MRAVEAFPKIARPRRSSPRSAAGDDDAADSSSAAVARGTSGETRWSIPERRLFALEWIDAALTADIRRERRAHDALSPAFSTRPVPSRDALAQLA